MREDGALLNSHEDDVKLVQNVHPDVVAAGAYGLSLEWCLFSVA